jgi:hypothetical protein
MSGGKPDFDNWYEKSPTQRVYVDIYWSEWGGHGEWLCFVGYLEREDPEDDWWMPSGIVQYSFINASDSATPPRTGWTLEYCDDWGVHEPFVVSAPTMSGGQPCTPPSFVITGLGPDGAILDRSLAASGGGGSDGGLLPIMVGLQPLAAVYDVGDLVMGACSIDDEAGRTVSTAWIHVYIYSIDIEPRTEVATLLDHWVVHYDRARDGYAYSWDTKGFAPGYYDVYLSFSDGTSHTCRIQLIAPTE